MIPRDLEHVPGKDDIDALVEGIERARKFFA